MKFTRVMLFASLVLSSLFFTNAQAQSPHQAGLRPAAAFAAPQLLAPAQGSLPNIIRPLFDWSDVPGATSYNIMISIYSNFAWLVVNTNVATSSFTPTTDLPRNTTIYWRVRVVSPSVGATAAGSFMAPNPPYSPPPISPGLGAVVTNYTPTLVWSASPTPLPAGTTFAFFELQVAANVAFSPLMIDQQGASTSFTFTSALTPNSTYYWRVRAANTLNQFSMWRTSHFNTALLPPTLLSPAASSVVTTLRPVFDWNDVPGNAGYGLQVSANASFSSLLVNIAVTPSTYTPTINLPSKTVIYWRVRTHGANLSDWSTSSFTTP